MPHGLCHGHEGARFVEVVDGFTRRAIGLGRAAFPGQGVAVPTEEGEAATQFTLFSRLFVLVPLRAGFRAIAVVGIGVFCTGADPGRRRRSRRSVGSFQSVSIGQTGPSANG